MDLLKTPKVLDKMRKFNRYVSKTGTFGTLPRGLFINYSNVCNFHCEQCFTQSPNGLKKSRLTIEKMKELADQADELGMYEIDIQGGEPLLYPDLFELISAFGPERFYLIITTNGYLLDEKMAKRLADAGISRVVVSLDSMKEEIHDQFRGKVGAHKHALKALENTKNVGMQPSVNFLVGHYNARTGEVEEMCKFCSDNGYQVGLIIATPTGNWKNNLEIMLDDEDNKHLQMLRKQYPNVWRDIWPPIDNTREKICGCPAVNRSYINPNGDVLPCPYLHMKIGNIFESSLKNIIDYGFSIRHFCEYNEKCFPAEDITFVKKYMQHDMSIMNPISVKDVFDEEDFIK